MGRSLTSAPSFTRAVLHLSVAILVAMAAVTPWPAAAQDLPPCDGVIPASGCQLAPWPEDVQSEIPSPFGPIDGRVWIEDEVGDVEAGGLDILATGIGSLEVEDAGAIRDIPGLLKRGRGSRAVRNGPAHVIRVVLDRPPDAITSGHASVHLATDTDGTRSNDAPAGVNDPDNPWVGWQDVYSLTYAATTGETSLFDSDLANGWYRDRGRERDFFAAAWAAPNVLDILVRPQLLGEELAILTFTTADGDAYDVLQVGEGGIPVDGRVGLVPRCTEAAILAEPYRVERLVENGQTLRDVEVPASWRGGVALPLEAEDREALASVVAALDEDGDGRIGLDSMVSLLESGLIIRQRPALELALDDEGAQLALQLGLTQRGHNVLRDIDPAPTGDPVADAWLEQASRIMVAALPPFRATRKGGLLQGGTVGACVPALTTPQPALAGGETDAAASQADAGG